MATHRFDPWSAVLAAVTLVTAGFVITGAAPDPGGADTWWLALVAFGLGLAIIPWRRTVVADHLPTAETGTNDASTADR